MIFNREIEIPKAPKELNIEKHVPVMLDMIGDYLNTMMVFYEHQGTSKLNILILQTLAMRYLAKHGMNDLQSHILDAEQFKLVEKFVQMVDEKYEETKDGDEVEEMQEMFDSMKEEAKGS